MRRKRRCSATCNSVRKVADEEKRMRMSEKAIMSARGFALFLS